MSVEISPEELWALVGDDDVAEFRGPDREIDDFDRKRVRDMEIFAEALTPDALANTVVIHDGRDAPNPEEEDDLDEEFFDCVPITRE
jgi:hypothetical protein